MLNIHYHSAKYVLLFCFVLFSCTPVQQIHNFSTQTSSPRPIETLQPLPSATSPVVESTPTASMTSAKIQKLKEIAFSPCLTVSPKPPEGNQIPWLLLVQRAAVYSIEPNSGLKSAQLIPSPEYTDPFALNFALSPDGKWLAYELSGENDELVIEPSSNLLTKSSRGRIVSPAESLFQLHGWLSNELIVLRIYRNPDRFLSTLIRNPFTKEEHEFFLEEMPDYMDYQPGGIQGAMLFANSNLMPDPTLKRVVYPSKNDSVMAAALWDLENEKVIAKLRLFFDWAYNDPLWSLDGNDFIIMGIDEKNHEEWFQITKDGTIKQITHFGEFLNDFRFGSSSRSPDGRYLAFTLWNERNTYEDSPYKYKYLILDLKSQSLDGFCIDTRGKSNPYKPFAWSPDSKYLTITNGTVGERSAEVILVNLGQQNAFRIATDVEAIGWMVKP